MRLRNTAALALVGWYLETGRSGKGELNRPARGSAGRHAIITIPGKPNTLTEAPFKSI
jgi:hypothetical protein